MSENYKLNLYPFLAAFFAAIVVYGFELTHFTMSIDEEFSDNFYQTVALGRWGHSFLRQYLLPEPYAPFFTTLISLLFLSLSASITSRIANLDLKWSCVMSVLYIAIPQFAYQLEFANQSDTVAIATVFSTLSVLLFIKGSSRFLSLWSLGAIISYAFAMSVYQSFTILPVTLSLVYVCFYLKNNKDGLSHSLWFIINFAIVSIISTFVYIVATYLVQSSLGIHGGSYLSDMIKWGHGDFASVSLAVFDSIKKYFTFHSYYGLSIFSLSGIAFICLIFSGIHRKNHSSAFILAIIIMLLSPFIMIIGLGGNQPPRAMASLSPAFSSALVLAMMLTSYKWVSYTVTSIVLLIGSANASRLFYSDYMSLQSDILLANRIVTTIEANEPSFNQGGSPIYFYGRKKLDNEWRLKKSDVFGNSFFAWDGGNNKRIIAFMKVNGIANFKRVDRNQVNELRAHAERMKIWPDKQSIQVVNGVLIVKLGDTPGID